jgi:hypothetical protein
MEPDGERFLFGQGQKADGKANEDKASDNAHGVHKHR